MLEALWLHQYHNVVDVDLLKQMLRSATSTPAPPPRACSATGATACRTRWNCCKTQAADEHPRVRLEAVRAASFFHDEEALNVALELLTHPDDHYLQYTFNETLNTLERRLGGEGKLDRKNIAMSLLKMLDKAQVSAARKPALMESIIRLGTPAELDVLWQRAAKASVLTPAAAQAGSRLAGGSGQLAARAAQIHGGGCPNIAGQHGQRSRPTSRGYPSGRGVEGQ